MATKAVVGAVALLVSMSATPVFAGKQEARDVGQGLSVIAAAGVVTPEPTTSALGIGGLIGEGVGFLGMGLWNAFASAPANPDANHGQIASVAPVTFTAVSGTGSAVDSVNDSMVSAATMVDESRLLELSLRRYYGAVSDENAANTQLQLRQSSKALSSLEVSIDAYRSDLRAISDNVQGTEFALLSATESEALALRDTIIADNAFPAFEQFVFDEMRATPREMDLAILEVTMVDGSTMDDSDLGGAVIFDRYAYALGKVDLRELLPSGFDPVVPLPGAAWMGGPLLVAAGVVGKVRRSRKRF